MTYQMSKMWDATMRDLEEISVDLVQDMLSEMLNRVEEAEEYLRSVYGNPRYFETVQWRMAAHLLDTLAGHPDRADD